ncbi:MAG: ribonuclease HI [Kiritimatiellia bacterium]|jgi:ribonuclease HI
MSRVLYVSSSAYKGNVGWAWSLDEQHEAGAFVPGSAYRGAMFAAIEGLSHLDAGVPVEVRTSNETLASVGADWMAAWRERDWDKRGGIKHLDLVRLLSIQDERMQLTWTLHESKSADFKAVKALAQAARKTLPEPSAEAVAARAVASKVEPATTRMRTVAYTDGGCRGNPGGVGGWGLLLIDTRSGRALERWGAVAETTNNRMEMRAALEALRSLRGREQPIEIRTDSKYLHDAATSWVDGWRRRGWCKANGDPIANADLVESIDDLQRQHRVVWTWVRGHQGEPGNELVDGLATRAMDAMQRGETGSGEQRHTQSPVKVVCE